VLRLRLRGRLITVWPDPTCHQALQEGFLWVLRREARVSLRAVWSWVQAFQPTSQAEVLLERFAGRKPLNLAR
jgi:hypothetical protein